MADDRPTPSPIRDDDAATRRRRAMWVMWIRFAPLCSRTQAALTTHFIITRCSSHTSRACQDGLREAGRKTAEREGLLGAAVRSDCSSLRVLTLRIWKISGFRISSKRDRRSWLVLYFALSCDPRDILYLPTIKNNASPRWAVSLLIDVFIWKRSPSAELSEIVHIVVRLARTSLPLSPS